MPLLPADGSLVVAELPLAREKLRRVEVPAAVATGGRNHVVEHLVVDDERDEVAGNPGSIERRVDPDQSIDRGVAPELDRAARVGSPPAAHPLGAPQVMSAFRVPSK